MKDIDEQSLKYAFLEFRFLSFVSKFLQNIGKNRLNLELFEFILYQADLKQTAWQGDKIVQVLPHSP